MKINYNCLIIIICVFFLSIVIGCVPTTTQLTSENGIKNSVSFYPSDLPNSPAVMILPGRGNTPENYTNLARKMSKSGINVILVRYNTLGQPKWNQYVNQERGGTEDAVKNEVTTALNFLNSQQTVDRDRIGILGGSMGTWVGFVTMAKYKNLKSLAMLSPICAPGTAVGKGYTFETYPGTKELADAFGDRNLLLIGSKNDRSSSEFPTAVENSEYLSSIMANAKIEKKYYPGKAHAYFMLSSHIDLSETIVQWFMKTL